MFSKSTSNMGGSSICCMELLSVNQVQLNQPGARGRILSGPLFGAGPHNETCECNSVYCRIARETYIATIVLLIIIPYHFFFGCYGSTVVKQLASNLEYERLDLSKYSKDRLENHDLLYIDFEVVDVEPPDYLAVCCHGCIVYDP